MEALESQMREMSSLMSDTEAKKSEKESELRAAVDKIWVLRDIIADLEQQLQAKIEREESLQMQINQLETVITAQTKNQQELVQELDAIKSGSENRHLNEQINHLQVSKVSKCINNIYRRKMVTRKLFVFLGGIE